MSVLEDFDTPRSEDMALYNYGQLCFNFDNLRGYTAQLIFGDNNLLTLGLDGLLTKYYPDDIEYAIKKKKEFVMTVSSYASFHIYKEESFIKKYGKEDGHINIIGAEIACPVFAQCRKFKARAAGKPQISDPEKGAQDGQDNAQENIDIVFVIPPYPFQRSTYTIVKIQHNGDKKEVAAAFGRHQQPGEQAPDLSVHQSCHIQDQKREDVRLYKIQDIPDHIEYYKLQRQIADSVFSEFLFKIAHQIPPGS